MKNKIIKYLLLILIFILYCGIYPRELQENAPTVFALGAVVVILFTKKIIKNIWN